MKKIQNITAPAFLLGASALVSAQTTETVQTPHENISDTRMTTTDDEGDGGKWGLVGLLGFLGLIRMRPNRDHHRDNTPLRPSNAH